MRKTNNMHLYLINLYQLNYSLHVPNKKVQHQEIISVLTAHSITHAFMGCLAANTIRLNMIILEVNTIPFNRMVLAAKHPIDA
jgi:hypothetical protein